MYAVILDGGKANGRTRMVRGFALKAGAQAPSKLLLTVEVG
jgi:hypothetical protein